MAATQAKVNSFFKAKKSSNINASKRRKIQNLQEDSVVSQVLSEEKTLFPEPIIQTKDEIKENLNVQTVNKSAESQTKKAPATRSRASTRSTRSTRSTAKAEDIRKLLHKNAEDTERALSPTVIRADGLATAACDDHDGGSPATPTKRPTRAEENVTKEKRSRKTVKRDQLREKELDDMRTPEKGFDFSKYLKDDNNKSSSRRRLILKRRTSGDGEAPILKLNTDEETDTKPKENAQTKEISRTRKDKTKESKSKEGVKDSETNKNSKELVKQKPVVQNEEPKSKEVTKKSDEVKEKISSIEKSKIDIPDLKKLDPKAMKLKLAKSGKLAELQQRLTQFSEAAAKVQESKEARAKAETQDSTTKKVPAFERFHALAQAVPPTLTLPYQYKLLAEMFNSVDTVLSMLYKRSETCTFARLKTSVQNLMKRNFEEKNLGQIKTVYPTALKFRQEKNVPGFTKKESGYQLTIEPDLTDVTYEDETSIMTDDGRVAMTAAKMIQRKKIFHYNLVEIVKGHHRTFLGSLDRPLSVDDDKINRWHQKFLVDQVPMVEKADLPEPPEVYKIFTATAALEEARGRFTPKTVKALERVSSASKEATNKDVTPAKTAESPASTPKKAPPVTTPAVKGVSQSLLERIRAKEAAKQQALMMRSPQQDRRIAMLGRLPEVARILRTFFVTLKKPAVLLEDAVEKVSDSYKSCMGKSEAEAHVKMVVEMLPEWVQTVTIKRGTFLKLDKNKDFTQINEKLSQKLKEASR